MSRSGNLNNLQQVDSQIDQLQARLREIELILANNEELSRVASTAQEAETKYIESQKILRSAETKVKNQRLKISQNEATLYSGKINNPKELQDLHEEAAALKRFLDVLEERQLEAMLILDEVAEEHKKAVDDLHLVQVRTEALKGELLAETVEIDSLIENLQTQRQHHSSALSEEENQLYDRLRQQKGGIAVARVYEQACSACGATLTAALFQKARSPSQITHCETCGRILFAA
jgi:predicted  nucleic acid-binding Zn-ribbon protein